MSDLPTYPELLGDERLSAHATSTTPAWLWSTDGTRILWANAVGAAAFGITDPAAIVRYPVDVRQGMAAQMQRLSGTLAYGGASRLEKLRGIGAFGRAVLCSCARVVVAGHTPAILVIALEPAGPKLPLSERVRRLVHAAAGTEAAAAFNASGELLYASPVAAEALGAASLRRLGMEIAEHGGAANTEAGHSIVVTRLGQGPDAISIATLARIHGAPQDHPLALPLAADTVPEPMPTLQSAPAQEAPRPDDEAPAAVSVSAPEQRATMPGQADAETSPQIVGEAAGEDEAQSSQDPAVEPEDSEQAIATQGAETPFDETPPSAPSTEAPAIERRHPLRFVWQMDGEGRFTLGSEEFTDVIGPRMAVTLGRPWIEVARELALDPEDQVARAVATRDTWSGITISWPVEGSSERLKVEMSGLPVFDRTRTFLGYRGFGVCRDVERINLLAHLRRRNPPFPTAGFVPPQTDADAERLASETAEALTEAPASGERPTLTLVPTAKNVVPFRGGPAEVRSPALSPVEHSAFRELARQLTARLRDNGEAAEIGGATPSATSNAGAPMPAADAAAPADTSRIRQAEPVADVAPDRPLLDRLSVGILAYRFDQLLYANRAFLDWSGCDDLEAFAEAGGLDGLLIETDGGETDDGRVVTIASPDDKRKSAGRLFTVPWEGDSALVLVVDDACGAVRREADALETARRTEQEARELAFVVEVASDAVLVVDRLGAVLSANGRAHSLFSPEGGDFVGKSLFDLFAPESQRVVRHQFDVLTQNQTEGPVTDGREVAARVKANGHVVLLMTMGRIGEAGERFCVVLRDITAWKTQEHELVAAKLQAERASRAKSDFLAKVSHEIRTPLNSIIGFSDVMIEERFGPIGNERYREYLKDIRTSGEHVVSLLNDLLDLSKIEAGKLELNFIAVNLNEMIQACVMLMQPQANREHIIIRTSLLSTTKPVLADAKAVRQIILNLLSNSIKFTGAGGQVIVSTALSDDGGVAMRVRDTGIGMSESDLAAALEPFRQLATAARWGSSGTGLGLPLTKALIEANRATFLITSKINEGTLVEVTFPASRLAGG